MSSSPPIDVAEIMREIRERVRQKQANATTQPKHVNLPSVPAVDAVHTPLSQLRQAIEQLDALPPQPETARGSIGQFVSRLLRRLLFWQYAQAHSVGSALVACIESIVGVLQIAATRLSMVDQMELSVRATAGKLHRLNEQHEHLRTHSAVTEASVRGVSDRLEALSGAQGAVAADLQTIRATILELSTRMGQFEQHAQASAEKAAAFEAQIAARNSESGRVLDLEMRILQLRRDLLLQEQRINLVRQSRAQSTSEPESTMVPAPDPDPMSNLYLALEDAFRGSPGDIAERVSAYIPTLENAGIKPGTDVVLDIGCGRGEWLRLLTESGYANQGCDVNADMIAICREHGRSVVQQDALRFLRCFGDNSVGTITAFHVVEHLPLPTMLDLINESLRVLRPGGLLVLETPNPQNVIVASHNFYIDPTHRKPIPMPLLQFLVEARGFSKVEGRGLHPYPESMLLQDQSQVAERFNQFFYGPQDYAVIATKP